MKSTTPICDFVKEYAENGTSRFHMPGHKGASLLGCEPWDITEIEGADDLAHAEDIILDSEQNASSLFGSRHTFYSTGGSSQCIRAMIYLAWLYRGKEQGRRIVAARNAHKTFLHACALLDLTVTWLYPKSNPTTNATAQANRSADANVPAPDTEPSAPQSLCSCPVTPEGLRKTLTELCGSDTPDSDRRDSELPFAVFVTSPDYLGGMQDIAGLAAVSHEFGLPLLVDNAHGAYLKFLTPSLHPLDLGADMCCDSAHKTLPALTGCAYLHVSRSAPETYEADARNALALFGSTSPSYLLLQSLDQCNAYLSDGYPERLTEAIRRKEEVCETLREYGFGIMKSDPLRIVLESSSFPAAGNTDNAASNSMTGEDLADYLRKYQIECEYADQDYVVLMYTPENTEEDWKRLLQAASDFHVAVLYPQKKTALHTQSFQSDHLQKMSIREALMSRSVVLPVEQALGRICAAPVVSCPPAIPIVISGEEITEEAIEWCRYYGITELSVVAE